MGVTQAPPRAEFVRRAAGLVPLLRKHALWTEENRRLHDETIEALADAGLFKLRVPLRHGGYEADARTVVEVATQLGRGDGATAWTASVWWIPGWMVGFFPDEVQDEVYSTPNVRVCGTLSPTGLAERRPGGVVLNGKWGFISGALHSHWQEIIAVIPSPDGPPEPIMALVPMSELEIADDWYTSGLCGSGSVTTIANNVFVPQERIMPLGAMLSGQSASVLNADLPMYRAPLLSVAAATTVGTLIGLAKAAYEFFLERLPDRKITYTSYEKLQEAPITHLQVGEASVKIDEAEFHGSRVADLVDSKGFTGEPWTMIERARARADVGAVCELGKRAVDVLSEASGASSLYRSVPIQRIARDIQAISLHALVRPVVAQELYGRVLSGLEPNTFYV